MSIRISEDDHEASVSDSYFISTLVSEIEFISRDTFVVGHIFYKYCITIPPIRTSPSVLLLLRELLGLGKPPRYNPEGKLCASLHKFT